MNDAELPDEAIPAVVRDVVDDWALPPQRLGAPTWRERVRGRQTRRGSWGGFGRRVATAAGAAIVATVSLALVAVWLSTPRTSAPAVGVSPSPAASQVAAASAST